MVTNVVLDQTEAEREALRRSGMDRDARLSQRRAEMEQRFRGLAEGRLWYDGIFPHQWGAACYGAAARRWFLGDEPGAGKTRTAIGWLDLIQAQRVVLITEANLCAGFAGETSDLAPHRTILNLAKLEKKTRHARLDEMLRLKAGMVIVNYEMFRSDEEALGKILMWQADTVIVDEAHNMKNPDSAAFKNVQKIVLANNTCPECGHLVYGVKRPCTSCGWNIANEGFDEKSWHKAAREDKAMFYSTKSVKNVLPMTGTPLLNSPLDLYCIFHLVDPLTFYSLTWFKKTFTHPDYSSRRHAFSDKGLKLLWPLLKGHYLARTLPEVGIELPKQHVHVVRVEIDPERYPLQTRTIEQVSKYAAIMLSTGENTTIMHMISIILRKRQANVWPGGIEIKDPKTGEVMWSVGKEVRESAKMDEMLEKIEELHAQGKRQIVFSQFRTALAEFEQRVKAKGIRAVRMDGSTADSLRNQIKTNFYKAKGEAPKWDVVLVHYKTGGAGLNLTAATEMHILDEAWNGGVEEQAFGRNHRIGQDEETNVYIYRAPGVDVWMANLIAMKKRMVTKLGQAMSADKQISLMKDAIEKGEI